MPKSKTAKLQRHDPLQQSIEEGSGHLRSSNRARHKRQSAIEGSDDEGTGYMEPAATRKILDIARAQQQEIDEEDKQDSLKYGLRSSKYENDDEDEDEDEDEWVDDGEAEDEEEYAQLDFENMPEDANPEDLEIFSRYVEEQEGAQTINWADKIVEKVKEFQNQGGRGSGEDAEMQAAPVSFNGAPNDEDEEEEKGVMLPPKVIEVYSQVGELLSRYRSGKLPRAFKIIPTLKNWQDVLYVTDPEGWSNQALYEATRIFVAGMPTNKLHRFIQGLLLPRFRHQVKQDGSVNYHIYRALKKALFKPAAFFKGFLFPLLTQGQCSTREAVIASSVLARVSIPVLHSAAALLHIAELDYQTVNSVFIRVLLDKKYALPYKVVDAVVFHFVRFRAIEDPQPVIWHQSLLSFCQRYKNDITDDQRDALMTVARAQQHPLITPEVRRELQAGEPRMA